MSLRSFQKWIICLIVSSVFVLGGCTQNYTKSIVREFIAQSKSSSEYSVSRTSDWIMPISTKVTLAQITYEQRTVLKTYNRAYHALNKAVHDEFSQVFPFTRVVETTYFEQAISSAKLLFDLGQSDVLIIPQLLTFEDNLNSVQERREGIHIHPNKKVASDAIQIQLSVYASNTGQLIDVVLIHSSKGASRKKKHSAADLFASAVSEYLERMYTGFKIQRFS